MRWAITIWLLLLGFAVKSQQVVTLCPNEQTTFTYWSTSNQNGLWMWFLNNDTISENNSVTITWDSVGVYDIIVHFSNGCAVIPETDEGKYLCDVKLSPVIIPVTSKLPLTVSVPVVVFP